MKCQVWLLYEGGQAAFIDFAPPDCDHYYTDAGDKNIDISCYITQRSLARTMKKECEVDPGQHLFYDLERRKFCSDWSNTIDGVIVLDDKTKEGLLSVIEAIKLLYL
jgi:hypothetical protein